MASELSAGSGGLQEALPKTPITANNDDLPELSPADFRLYNKLAEMMQYYHNHFRHTWNTLHSATTSNKRPQGMSIRQFIRLGQSFVHQLTMHHNIEETYVFPMLARKMPKFRAQDLLKKQHEAIHEGLDKFEEYLSACQSGERELRMAELGEVMNSFGKVLWQHLDDEVNQLQASNMREFWTTDEMRRLDF